MSKQTALVTGASSAIGRSIACGFGRQDVTVAVGSRDRARGQATVDAVSAVGGKAFLVEFDARVPAQVERAIGSVVDRCGGLDLAVNNAGGTLGMSGPIPTFGLDEWDEVLGANLTCTWLCLKYELRQMQAAGHGSIVNTIGALGLRGAPNLAAYVASKHAVVGLTKTAALEGARYGVRVNGIAPSMTERDEPADVKQSRAASAAAKLPLGRIASVEEAAACALWLCSDAASFVTGHILAVDGGVTAGL